MLWCSETEFSVKPWSIMIVLALVSLLIPTTVSSWYIYSLKNECGFPAMYYICFIHIRMYIYNFLGLC